MPKKPWKTLGDVNAPCVLLLKDLMGTQSKDTLRKWSMDYAESKLLPIFETHCPGDPRPRNTIETARAYLAGNVHFTVAKNSILNECHAAARELDANPIAQAAARAIGQGMSVVHALTHALGQYFYAAAAIAYDRVGLHADKAVYEAIAEEVCLDYTAALRAIAVEDEQNPAKLNWHC